MIYKTPRRTSSIAARLAELDRWRETLGDQGRGAGPWLGRLRRQWRASAASSSIEIEGFHVSVERALALDSGRQTAHPDDDNQMALSCYARAMDHVGAMCEDPRFHWLDRVILDLHFDACHVQTGEAPGRYRRSPIVVTGRDGEPPAYVGPAHGDVPGLMDEVVGWLDRGDLKAHVAVRAAMAHLHLVSVHPFRDGNGRVARIVQSLVLARGGLLAPELLSIEEYLGRNTAAYYAVLGEVQGGSYQPDRNAQPWVEFCLDAHVAQARIRSGQLTEAAKRWSLLERLAHEHGWPERLVIALEQSFFEGVDRSSYAVEAAISRPTATNDLRRLLDAGLVEPLGNGPARRYRASTKLRQRIDRLSE
jgi:Fic family protein